ncbi:MAG: hypothetical protein ACK5FX_03070, partial [Flavobacteriia bacterium]
TRMRKYSTKSTEKESFKVQKFRSRYTSCVRTRPAFVFGQLTACPPRWEWPLQRLYRGHAFKNSSLLS